MRHIAKASEHVSTGSRIGARSSTTLFEQCDSAEIVRRIGEEGLRRIAGKAHDDLIRRRVKDAFRQAYDEFRKEWNAEKKAKRDNRGDALSGFGERMQVDRSTAGRYISGTIKTLDFGTISALLLRIGRDPQEVFPAREEINRAVLAATVAAMMRARGIRPERVSLTDDELDRVKMIADRIQNPPDAKASSDKWRSWFEKSMPVVREALDASSTSFVEEDVVRASVLTASDAKAVHKVLWSEDKRSLWQIVAALLGLKASEAQAAVPPLPVDDRFDGHERTPTGFAEYLLGGMDFMSKKFLDHVTEKGDLNLLRSMLRSRSSERSRVLLERLEAFVQETDVGADQYCRAQMLRAQLFYDLGDHAGASNSANNAWRKFMNREEDITFDDCAAAICKEYAPDPLKFLEERRRFAEPLPRPSWSTPQHDICREFFLGPLVTEVRTRGWIWG